MPAVQRGSLDKRGKTWRARWRDETGTLRSCSGFGTKSEAGEWLDAKLGAVSALRHGDVAAVRRQAMPTLQELVDEYVEQHSAEANTIRTLKARLRYATEGPALDGSGGFGSLRVDRLTVPELGAWRKRLPERSAHAIHKALRQVLAYAVRVKLLDENVAKLLPNPEPKRREVPSFVTMADVEAVAVELGPRFGAIPIIGALAGLRPEERIALERRDIDKAAGVLRVRRVFTDGQVKLYGKQSRSLRAVPLPARAADALAELPPRIDTPLLFPGERGGHLNLHNWRRDHWNPAVKAAGLEHRTPYALRHTYASFASADVVRVAVFIDWQNTYKSAREAFGWKDYPNEHGNYSPYQLARILAAGNERGANGELVRVNIHRGLPSQKYDQPGYAANRRQSAAWIKENPEIVIPRLRPLRYSRDQPPREKCVDVELAVAAVEWTLKEKCDVAVIFSHDTDLVPVLELLCSAEGTELRRDGFVGR